MIGIYEILRRWIYWMVDFLKGGKIRGHYNDIKFIMEKYHSPESTDKRRSYLDKLLEHAVATSEFYKDYKNFKSLEDFPVINKSIIRDRFNDIQSGAFKNKSNYSMSTSGSSGTPFTTLQNKGKRSRNTADTIYFKQKAGFEIGYRLYYIRKWFRMHQKSRLTTWARNIRMVNVTEFTDSYLQHFIDTLREDKSTKVLLSYSSALRDICNYLRRSGCEPIQTKISCIIAMSEGLGDNTRKDLEYFFNTSVLLRYSNLENGILALQLPNAGTCLHINWASYHIEILHPEKDIPAAVDEMGRVVVTDLFNYCMPFIRYDTGDLAIMSKDNDHFNKAPCLLEVHGRQMDAIFDTLGKIQSTFIIFHLESYPQIKQFQFIQEHKRNYTLKLNVEETFDAEQEVIDIFKNYLGGDAIIKIVYVDEIPQLSSGKRRLTINNYSKETGIM